ncbi:MAG: hypothetical protein DWQ31_21625 [Planctomycetota bacterium]|nr:MAG: hypothetical protein DWQ31_21625 [Planctomycetota bacterium]REJ93726.1 MAG: hypothetical protein DWQ35_10160 [Planctomycetota bacterium]REK25776.1 MAG: hypothetical protein DWQ42_10895 [Planctomycetota bacterium]
MLSSETCQCVANRGTHSSVAG